MGQRGRDSSPACPACPTTPYINALVIKTAINDWYLVTDPNPGTMAVLDNNLGTIFSIIPDMRITQEGVSAARRLHLKL
ncbi:hypothetical protein BDC45DRAFT_567203 [Circinella umbellata]|nr:hypothetical protein BDC45DRAFT_567203 [Circinella umbellata]